MKKITRINNYPETKLHDRGSRMRILADGNIFRAPRCIRNRKLFRKTQRFCQLCSLESVLLIRGQFTRCRFITSSPLHNSRDYPVVDLTFLSGELIQFRMIRM